MHVSHTWRVLKCYARNLSCDDLSIICASLNKGGSELWQLASMLIYNQTANEGKETGCLPCNRQLASQLLAGLAHSAISRRCDGEGHGCLARR